MIRPGIHPRRVLNRLGRVFLNDQFVLLVLAIIIGAVSGYGAIAFRLLIDLVQSYALGAAPGHLYEVAAELPAWRLVLSLTLGGLLIGLFIHFLMPGRRYHGVADVIEASALRGGRMSFRAGIGAALASAASIGVGASVGREGPVVHLGAALSSSLARRLHLSRSLTLTLLGCGVASAIAASFNAPIAGVIFALEVVVGHYALSSFAPIVIASVIGTMISRIHYGDFPAFIVAERTIVSFLELPAFALLGVVSAAVAIAFMYTVLMVSDRMAKLAVPGWLKPMIGGLLMGLIALYFPQVLGVGYGITDAALKELLSLEMLLAILMVKIAATAICLGSGFGGGVFSPSLVIGAMLGGAFGIVATGLFPELSSGQGAYTIVGMGAVAGAVLGAPISTILIIFELTSDFPLTIAVMVGVVFASMITQQTAGKSFFTMQLARRGLSLKGGREISLLQSIDVRKVMTREFVSVPTATGIARLRKLLPTVPYGELFVISGVKGEANELVGTITLADLSDEAFDTTRDHILNAGDIARQNPPVLEERDSLDTALELMDAIQEDQVAVVENTKSMKLVGIVRERDVMRVYYRALAAERAEEHG